MKLRQIIIEDEYAGLEDNDEFGVDPCPDCDCGELLECGICSTICCYSIDRMGSEKCEDEYYNLEECEGCNSFVCKKCRIELYNGTYLCSLCMHHPIKEDSDEYEGLEDNDEFGDNIMTFSNGLTLEVEIIERIYNRYDAEDFGIPEQILDAYEDSRMVNYTNFGQGLLSFLSHRPDLFTESDEYEGLEDNDEFRSNRPLWNNPICMYCGSDEDNWRNSNELIDCDDCCHVNGHMNCVLQTPEDRQKFKHFRDTNSPVQCTFSSGWSTQLEETNTRNNWFCPDCSPTQITEDTNEYAGLQDNDEFEDNGISNCDGCGYEVHENNLSRCDMCRASYYCDECLDHIDFFDPTGQLTACPSCKESDTYMEYIAEL